MRDEDEIVFVSYKFNITRDKNAKLPYTTYLSAIGLFIFYIIGFSLKVPAIL